MPRILAALLLILVLFGTASAGYGHFRPRSHPGSLNFVEGVPRFQERLSYRYRLFIHATATMANIPAITPRKNHAQCRENQNEAISSTAPTSNANVQRVACF